jgi:uncharacterized protein (DUF2267 family)
MVLTVSSIKQSDEIMPINFEKFTAEGHELINELSASIGHPNEKARTGILLRSVLHVLRDSITIPQSFNLFSQLPMYLKGLYVEQWHYKEKPERIKTLKEFSDKVELQQRKYGEKDFDWSEKTEELTKKTLCVLNHKYLSPGQVHDIVAELPLEIKELFSATVKC